MRVRKAAKQLKRMYNGTWHFDADGWVVYNHKPRQRVQLARYLIRCTRRNYFGQMKKARRHPGTNFYKLTIHNANSPYIFNDIAEYWGIYL